MLRKIAKSIISNPESAVKDLFLCLLSAVLLILSFPNYNLWILAWFGFVPLFFALRNKSKGKAFLFSYLTGVIFWFGIIYWLIHVTLPGMIILVLYLALYFGLFGLIVSTYLLPTTYYLSIPCLWVLLEYLRSHLFTGFPWALLGYSQYLNLPVIQIADITGVWGVSFLIIMVNLMLKEVLGVGFWALGRRKQIMAAAICCILVSAAGLGYGYYKLHQIANTKHQTPIKICVIQGNIPQELNWVAEAKDFIISKYLALTAQVAKNNKPDLIIWPEASLPIIPQEEPVYFERIKYFVKAIDIPLLLGAVTLKDAEISACRRDTSDDSYIRHNFYYNSAILISQQGDPLAEYDKTHLVPLGEYIPLKKIFGFLKTLVPIGEFVNGKEYTVFTIPNHKFQIPNFSVLICFEDAFAELSRRFVKQGADFLINITNDAWFKETSAPYQHLQASVFRAVENRVFLVRSANTGVSGFIAPSGRIISKVSNNYGKNIFIDGYDTEEIAIPERRLSFYTRYGDIFIIFCLGTVLIRIIKCPFKRATFALGTD